MTCRLLHFWSTYTQIIHEILMPKSGEVERLVCRDRIVILKECFWKKLQDFELKKSASVLLIVFI